MENNEANALINEEYDQGPLNLDEGEQWLRRTSQEVKSLPIQAKHQWLRSVELARLPYDRDTVTEYRTMNQERQAMADWLVPAPTAAATGETQAEEETLPPRQRKRQRPANTDTTQDMPNDDEKPSVEPAATTTNPKKKRRREELPSKKRKRDEAQNTSTE